VQDPAPAAEVFEPGTLVELEQNGPRVLARSDIERARRAGAGDEKAVARGPELRVVDALRTHARADEARAGFDDLDAPRMAGEAGHHRMRGEGVAGAAAERRRRARRRECGRRREDGDGDGDGD
jgi:hypothetical protein